MGWTTVFYRVCYVLYGPAVAPILLLTHTNEHRKSNRRHMEYSWNGQSIWLKLSAQCRLDNIIPIVSYSLGFSHHSICVVWKKIKHLRYSNMCGTKVTAQLLVHTFIMFFYWHQPYSVVISDDDTHTQQTHPYLFRIEFTTNVSVNKKTQLKTLPLSFSKNYFEYLSLANFSSFFFVLLLVMLFWSESVWVFVGPTKFVSWRYFDT